jgi:hypothetical protein
VGAEMESLSDHWASILSNAGNNFGLKETSVRVAICNYNILQIDRVPSPQKDREFIENFKKDKLDSSLIAKHFSIVGRYEGRPYKYCDSNGNLNEENKRDTSMAVILNSLNGKFYDYSANLFCLNKCEDKSKCDGKVYKIK